MRRVRALLLPAALRLAPRGADWLTDAARRPAALDRVIGALVGASAAYMAAIAADRVVARETAITGSIGVIFQYAHFEKLLEKIGAERDRPVAGRAGGVAARGPR